MRLVIPITWFISCDSDQGGHCKTQAVGTQIRRCDNLFVSHPCDTPDKIPRGTRGSASKARDGFESRQEDFIISSCNYDYTGAMRIEAVRRTMPITRFPAYEPSQKHPPAGTRASRSSLPTVNTADQTRKSYTSTRSNHYGAVRCPAQSSRREASRTTANLCC